MAHEAIVTIHEDGRVRRSKFADSYRLIVAASERASVKNRLGLGHNVRSSEIKPLIKLKDADREKKTQNYS